MPADSNAAFKLRSYYVNFASHLLNGWNANMVHPEAGGAWGAAEFDGLLEMIKSFGYNCFEFWLEPTLYAAGPDSAEASAFTKAICSLISSAHEKGLKVKCIVPPNTFGQKWYCACPKVGSDRKLILDTWGSWSAAFKGMDIMGIFPGDPGGCNRNGCDHSTFIELALRLTEIALQKNPKAIIELGTWGTPFSGWGDDAIRFDAWDGYFASIVKFAADKGKCHIWNGTPERAERAMADLLKRLPQFPSETMVSINLGFCPDSDCTVGGDARGYANEIAKTNRITSWDYAVTEGELVVHPHWRLPRIFSRRREERFAAPYFGASSYTMSPMLSHLCMYAAAQAAINPDLDPDAVSRDFCRKVFGPGHEALGLLFEAFEVVPGWGHYPRRKYSPGEARKAYAQIIEHLEAADMTACELPLFPSPEHYRKDLLWFAKLFHTMASPNPDREAVRREYARVCYGVYEKAPKAVDERSENAAKTFSSLFMA